MTTKRTIFEEVGAGAAAPLAPRGGLIDGRAKGARNGIRLWLVAIVLLVAAMIMVGGLTRLTDSGLSITEWKPVMGAVPPLNATDWATAFSKYQATAEFQSQNAAMTVAQFKTIYLWEWAHRELGRLIGLVWAVGFAGFLLARKIPTGWTGRLLTLGVLGGLQGAIGWWMVTSGLTGDAVDVASYRLAVHLGLAFTILGLAANAVFQLGRTEADLMQARRSSDAGLLRWAAVLVGVVFIQVLLGALVAGIDAGRGFPTWPDMNGSFFPADAFYVPGRPAWAAFFENPGLVQFVHRIWAYALLGLGLFLWFRARKSGNHSVKRGFDAVAAMLAAQVVLGIVTALMAARLEVAITHQIGAVILFVLVLRARHLVLYPLKGSIRKGTA